MVREDAEGLGQAAPSLGDLDHAEEARVERPRFAGDDLVERPPRAHPHREPADHRPERRPRELRFQARERLEDVHARVEVRRELPAERRQEPAADPAEQDPFPHARLHVDGDRLLRVRLEEAFFGLGFQAFGSSPGPPGLGDDGRSPGGLRRRGGRRSSASRLMMGRSPRKSARRDGLAHASAFSQGSHYRNQDEGLQPAIPGRT